MRSFSKSMDRSYAYIYKLFNFIFNNSRGTISTRKSIGVGGMGGWRNAYFRVKTYVYVVVSIVHYVQYVPDRCTLFTIQLQIQIRN